MMEELEARIEECLTLVDPNQASKIVALALYNLKTYPHWSMEEAFEHALINAKL